LEFRLKPDGTSCTKRKRQNGGDFLKDAFLLLAKIGLKEGDEIEIFSLRQEAKQSLCNAEKCAHQHGCEQPKFRRMGFVHSFFGRLKTLRGYPILMQKKSRRPKPNHPQEVIVYVVRCRDKSLYTGITTDLERRFDSTILGPPLDTLAAAYRSSHLPRAERKPKFCVEARGAIKAMTSERIGNDSSEHPRLPMPCGVRRSLASRYLPPNFIEGKLCSAVVARRIETNT